eukprot:gene13847-15923_t
MNTLPVFYRQGKMPYVFSFVMLVVTVLLLYVGISPYQNATPMFLSMAVFLLMLLILLNFGMPLAWGVHIGTCAGALVLFFSAWSSGGVFSPRLAWLLILPLTPFYVMGRKAGTFWLIMVWLMQLSMAACNHYGLLPTFEQGLRHALSSWVTYTLVTGVLIIVPLIYDRMHLRALERSLRYQQELVAKRQELEHTLHMREHFIATVSHELRTPMNAILGFNSLLLSRVKDKPEALKVLNHTRQSADHLMTVINDILDYSQLQAGQLVIQPETFELRPVAEHAFELFGPRAAKPPEHKPNLVKTAVQTSHKRWSFLIVDDHPLNRLLVKQVLQNAWPNSTILEAVDGQKALDTLREQPVDLILMDMVMPVMDGIVATSTLRQTFGAPHNALPVLGMTANVNPLDLERFKAAGLSDVMLKPFEPEVLCGKIDQLLSKT